MSPTYRVMLDGLAANRDPDEVAAHLARILNAAPGTVRALLESRGVVVREGIDRDEAMRCRAVLERAGCRAVVNREIPVVAPTRPGAQPPELPAAPDVMAAAPSTNKFSASRTVSYAIGFAIALLVALIVSLPK